MTIYLQKAIGPYDFELVTSSRKFLHCYWVFKSAAAPGLPIPALFIACKDSEVLKKATYFSYQSAQNFVLKEARKDGRTLADKLNQDFVDRTSQSLKTN